MNCSAFNFIGLLIKRSIIFLTVLVGVVSCSEKLKASDISVDNVIVTFHNDGFRYDTGCLSIAKRSFKIGKPPTIGQVFTCSSPKKSNDIAVLYVHGGPFGDAFREQYSGEQCILMSRGYSVWEPGYNGDNDSRVGGFRDYRFENNIDLSIRQIRTVLKYLQKRHGEVFVYGESLGGYLVSFLAAEMRASDRLVIDKAPLAEPEETWIKDRPPEGILGLDPGIKETPELKKIMHTGSLSIVHSLFAPYLHRTVAQNLRSNTAGWTVVMVGENDERTRPKYWPEIRRVIAGRGRFVVFKDGGHEGLRNERDLRLFEDAIWPSRGPLAARPPMSGARARRRTSPPPAAPPNLPQ